MASGRKPIPTNIKVLKNTLRKNRVLKNEVAYSLVDGLPKAPPHLKHRAKKEWDKIVKSLDSVGVLTENDLTVLESYCFNVGMMERAMKELNKDGVVGIETNNIGAKYMAESKWVNIYNKSVDRIIKIASEFGFTPSSRTRIGAPAKKRKDVLSGFR